MDSADHSVTIQYLHSASMSLKLSISLYRHLHGHLRRQQQPRGCINVSLVVQALLTGTFYLLVSQPLLLDRLLWATIPTNNIWFCLNFLYFFSYFHVAIWTYWMCLKRRCAPILKYSTKQRNNCSFLLIKKYTRSFQYTNNYWIRITDDHYSKRCHGDFDHKLTINLILLSYINIAVPFMAYKEWFHWSIIHSCALECIRQEIAVSFVSLEDL